MAAMISSNGALAGASWRSRHQSEMSRMLFENCCSSSPAVSSGTSCRCISLSFWPSPGGWEDGRTFCLGKHPIRTAGV